MNHGQTGNAEERKGEMRLEREEREKQTDHHCKERTAEDNEVLGNQSPRQGSGDYPTPITNANSTLTGCESLEHDEITDPEDPIHPRRGQEET